MRVRGPRIRRLVVRAERRWQPGLVVAVVTGALLLAGMIGFYLGRDSILDAFAAIARDSGIDPEANPRELIGALVSDNAAMRDEIAVQRGGRDLNREVEERVRQENRRLQDKVAALERAVAWYRKLSASGSPGEAGLRVERLVVSRDADDPQPGLHLLLVRSGETDGVYRGELDGTVGLLIAGDRQTLPLKDLLSAEQRSFQVRYVEEKRLRLPVPAGALVERVEILARVSEPQAVAVAASWQR